MYRTARFHIGEFGQWWANPKEKSKEFAPEIKVRLKDRLKTSKCKCAWCMHTRDQQKLEKKELERRQRELSIDSDDDEEFAAERAYWAERVQTDVGEAYEITRMKEGEVVPAWAKPSDRLAMMQYEYLEKRVRRYLGRNYRIVKEDFLNHGPQSTTHPGLLQSNPQSNSQSSSTDKGTVVQGSGPVQPQSAPASRPSVEGRGTPLLGRSSPEPTAPAPPLGGTEPSGPEETTAGAGDAAPESQPFLPRSATQPIPSPSRDGSQRQSRRSSSESIHSTP